MTEFGISRGISELHGRDLPDTVMSSGFFADDTEIMIFYGLDYYDTSWEYPISIEKNWPKAAQVNLATAVRRM